MVTTRSMKQLPTLPDNAWIEILKQLSKENRTMMSLVSKKQKDLVKKSKNELGRQIFNTNAIDVNKFHHRLQKWQKRSSQRFSLDRLLKHLNAMRVRGKINVTTEEWDAKMNIPFNQWYFQTFRTEFVRNTMYFDNRKVLFQGRNQIYFGSAQNYLSNRNNSIPINRNNLIINNNYNRNNSNRNNLIINNNYDRNNSNRNNFNINNNYDRNNSNRNNFNIINNSNRTNISNINDLDNLNRIPNIPIVNRHPFDFLHIDYGDHSLIFLDDNLTICFPTDHVSLMWDTRSNFKDILKQILYLHVIDVFGKAGGTLRVKSIRHAERAFRENGSTSSNNN